LLCDVDVPSESPQARERCKAAEDGPPDEPEQRVGTQVPDQQLHPWREEHTLRAVPAAAGQ